MNTLTPGEETMIAALARQVRDGDWAACGTLSPMPAAALWLAPLTHAPRAEVLVADRIGPVLKSSSAQVENLCHHIFSYVMGEPKAHE